MHVERTLTVPRPVEAVFAYLADFTRTNEWDPGTVETRRTSGDGGVGTTYANVSEFLGRRAELEYTTVVHEPSTRLQFRGRNARATALDTMTFARAADGTATELHYRADFDFGAVLNLLAPLVLRGRLERLADETVAQLERTLLNAV